MRTLYDRLYDQMIQLGMSDLLTQVLATLIILTGILVIGYIIDRIARRIMISGANAFAKRSKSQWDDILVENRVFSAITHLIPVLFVEFALPIFLGSDQDFLPYILRVNQVIIVAVFLIIINRFLNGVRAILETYESFKDKPIASYFQLAKIVIGTILFVLMLSILADKSVMYFFGAFGAMTAVIILVFKDTILGFIASIQLSVNDMIRVGDWVQMDKYGADGDVMEVNLTTVKVRNFDKTITTVPTYSFIADSFKNWRGMTETGSRRISRSILIDQRSIRFCTDEMLERYQKVQILSPYLEKRGKEIETHNLEMFVDTSEVANGRRMTNVGVFRAYVQAYLEQHPQINKELTLLVRQLAPTVEGLPIQVYAFYKGTAWVDYEGVQSDIFDHIMAAVSRFDLSIFQHPSGNDIQRALSAEPSKKGS